MRVVPRIVRIACTGLMFAILGCGGEPDRSRVVPSSPDRSPSGATDASKARESHKIEMH